MIIPVNHATGSYEIVLQNGALQSVGTWLSLNRKVLIVTDSGVPTQYAQTVACSCKEPVCICIEQGEASKSFTTLQMLLQTMLENGFTRKDCVVAVGGGVVGDLSGFAASCYMRGIDFYNIPTTLLSQVDSSVGGKTAVDFCGVKNIVGAFYPPKCVVIDPETLQTLDERQLHAGLAEAIKMSVTNDAQLFRLLEESTDLQKNLPEMIEKALKIKITVVEEDPTEQGLRKVLNFGHTLGHAVESCAKGSLLHGECVAIGMIPMCAKTIRQRVRSVLEKYCLPTEIPIKTEELYSYLIHDKKAAEHGITAVVSDEIGTFRFETLSARQILTRSEESR